MANHWYIGTECKNPDCQSFTLLRHAGPVAVYQDAPAIAHRSARAFPILCHACGVSSECDRDDFVAAIVDMDPPHKLRTH